ncbi:conserved hypothetical protein [Hyella patelloides LEGE 07179]|uniref:Uncharacterized protein n=1 Tax=Hyella patelloides LEGE 07179 TaxID=945734 RepID=A0A563VL71_9CYAN|nr:hypothetical protein [Hyella patelloides]VEP12200.1 conserved hypothetical protein [Hyella patelloides LEGE 07179]
MDIEILVGTWLLIGSTSTKSEVEFINKQPDPSGVSKWLDGKSHELIEQIELTEGLTLTITPDGKFTEEKTGNPQMQWFDSEGVCSDVIPFDGKLNFYKSNFYLIADNIPSWATPINKSSRKKLRYNDGDTKISDSLEIVKELLIRTVNVVTDELYLDRVIIAYKKASQ